MHRTACHDRALDQRTLVQSDTLHPGHRADSDPDHRATRHFVEQGLPLGQAQLAGLE
ncbi:hypothetical protein [Rhodoferax saidenbachensis]|uniref:Uncharacterized protein n=1 Tax=Rhodoferax saidenbachensis TaxID=1484693 RepID=A0ABU1ZQM7_9BURK|nr:hypothetical protein [Rhodoferax saidenbachensis]MDR7307862.1 hypothetical protein [Rhodoferax saidenbachensis]